MHKDFYWKLPVIAVTVSDHLFFGCPHCGQKNNNKGVVLVHTEGTSVWQCSSGLCQKITCLLPEGVKESELSFSDKKGDPFVPKLQEHPFSDIHHSRHVVSQLKSIGEVFKN